MKKEVLCKNKIYEAQIIGKDGKHLIKITNILEHTVIGLLCNEENETAVAKIADIQRLIESKEAQHPKI